MNFSDTHVRYFSQRCFPRKSIYKIERFLFSARKTLINKIVDEIFFPLPFHAGDKLKENLKFFSFFFISPRKYAEIEGWRQGEQ